MDARIIIQGKEDSPQLSELKRPIFDLTDNESIIFCVIEAGMVSGEPSVIIASENDHGSVALQTSLDKFLTSAATMASAAEHHWGWSRPEGSYTIVPPDKATRKLILEGLIKELEEWDDE